MKFPYSKSAIAAVLVLAGSAAAQAEGLYVGGSLGAPDYKSSVSSVGGNGGGTGLKLFGGWQVNPWLAVEGGYFNLGHISDASGKIKLQGAYADAVGSWAFAPQWSLLGRAGLAQGRFTSGAGDDWSPAFKLGAGVQYELTQKVALRAEYEHYRFSDAYDAKARVGQWSLGVKVGF